MTLERGPSLTDQAAQEIRARIVRGVFQLGEPLSEITLANELGVSKTPVREALMQLKRQGLVEVHPQRGTFVFDMNAQQVEKLSQLREVLETAALRLALASRRKALGAAWSRIVGQMRAALDGGDVEHYRVLDGGFHKALFELAGNPYLEEAFELISFRIQALRSRLSLDPELNTSSFDEHVRLAEMTRAGKTEEVEALLVDHIDATRGHYLAALGDTAAATLPLQKPRRRPAES